MIITRVFFEKNRAFTLIEVIAAVAIVVLIGALLFPVANSLKKTSSASKCISNLRHIYFCTLAFVEDHNGNLPPDLGSNTQAIPNTRSIHPRFSVNQYWWDTAYLGAYVLNQHNRRRDSAGKLKPDELHWYQCPEKHLEAPEEFWRESGGKITYVMRKLFQSPSNYRFHLLPNKSKRLFITEGLASTVEPGSARTGELGSRDTSRRLRRFHSGSINILFLDGHVEKFSGPDEDIASLMEIGMN